MCPDITSLKASYYVCVVLWQFSLYCVNTKIRQHFTYLILKWQQFACLFVCTAEDCYELGRLAYIDADYYHTVLWMQEALHRLNDPTQSSLATPRIERAVVLDYLAYAIFMVRSSTFSNLKYLTLSYVLP